MFNKFKYASAISVAATFLTAVFTSAGSGASAQVYETPAALVEPAVQFTANPVVQPLPSGDDAATDAVAQNSSESDADSLSELVSETAVPEELSSELKCLAGAIYFEAKSESLAGQLAVGRVIIARSKSGRFPSSYCGVVYQPSQFSFIRGGTMPSINTSSAGWKNAVRIAKIAHEGAWKSPVEGALFFHAKHVSPRWRLTRIASVDSHVFYR